MSKSEKDRIVNQIIDLLIKLTDDDKGGESSDRQRPAEMITIKECVSAVPGISEHSIRMLVAQDKIKYVRAGEGKRGKILVNKADLLSYFGA